MELFNLHDWRLSKEKVEKYSNYEYLNIYSKKLFLLYAWNVSTDGFLFFISWKEVYKKKTVYKFHFSVIVPFMYIAKLFYILILIKY